MKDQTVGMIHLHFYILYFYIVLFGILTQASKTNLDDNFLCICSFILFQDEQKIQLTNLDPATDVDETSLQHVINIFYD